MIVREEFEEGGKKRRRVHDTAFPRTAVEAVMPVTWAHLESWLRNQTTGMLEEIYKNTALQQYYTAHRIMPKEFTAYAASREAAKKGRQGNLF